MNYFNQVINAAVSWEFLEEASTELAKNSPLFLVVIVSFVIFWFMHRRSIKSINEMFEKSVSEIRTAHKDAMDALKDAYKDINNMNNGNEIA